MGSSEEKIIVNVQVKVPASKHKTAKRKMIDAEDNDEKSFQRLFMRALDQFIGTKVKRKGKVKKNKQKLKK